MQAELLRGCLGLAPATPEPVLDAMRRSVPAGDFECVHLYAEPQFFETFRDPDRPNDSVARLAAAFATDSAGHPHADVWIQADPPHAMVRAVGNLAASLRGVTETLALIEFSVQQPETTNDRDDTERAR